MERRVCPPFTSREMKVNNIDLGKEEELAALRRALEVLRHDSANAILQLSGLA
jgi:hypothetical protein